MLPLRSLRDEFFDDDIHHRPGRECEEVRQNGGHKRSEKNDEYGSYRLHYAAESPDKERLSPGVPRRPHRHRYDRPFWDILDGDADRRRQGCRRGYADPVAQRPRYDDSHGHAFRDIVDGDGEGEHRSPGHTGLQALRPVVSYVQMRSKVVYGKEEAHSEDEARGGGEDGQRALAGGHLHTRDEQRPNGCRDHHPGGEAEQSLPEEHRNVPFHKENEGRADERAGERDEKSYYYRCLHNVL